jgi:hypothetical protein
MKPRLLALLIPLVVCAPAASAQDASSIGLGAVIPRGDYADVVDAGFSLRLQSSTAYDRSELQFQTGWSRFSGREDSGVETESADVFHVALGVRIGGTLFVGANGGYFWGDTDDGLGFLPEAGIRLGRLELVADYRTDGDENWLGVRAAVRL